MAYMIFWVPEAALGESGPAPSSALTWLELGGTFPEGSFEPRESKYLNMMTAWPKPKPYS